jgi:tetratricopeptide (TPR) repeat protein
MDAGVIAAMIFLATRNRLAALGVTWFWAALLPVSNIVPLFIPMADRFLYVPLLGASILVALAIHAVGKFRPWAFAVAALAICACTVITFRREAVWHDSLALWQDTVAQNPRSAPAQNNLGWALLDSNRGADAALSFQRAISLAAGHMPDAWAGLALARDATGQTTAADDAYRRAIQLDPRYAHPQELVRALTEEPAEAGKLEVVASRVRAR